MIIISKMRTFGHKERLFIDDFFKKLLEIKNFKEDYYDLEPLLDPTSSNDLHLFFTGRLISFKDIHQSIESYSTLKKLVIALTQVTISLSDFYTFKDQRRKQIELIWSEIRTFNQDFIRMFPSQNSAFRPQIDDWPRYRPQVYDCISKRTSGYSDKLIQQCIAFAFWNQRDHPAMRSYAMRVQGHATQQQAKEGRIIYPSRSQVISDNWKQFYYKNITHKFNLQKLRLQDDNISDQRINIGTANQNQRRKPQFRRPVDPNANVDHQDNLFGISAQGLRQIQRITTSQQYRTYDQQAPDLNYQTGTKGEMDLQLTQQRAIDFSLPSNENQRESNEDNTVRKDRKPQHPTFLPFRMNNEAPKQPRIRITMPDRSQQIQGLTFRQRTVLEGFIRERYVPGKQLAISYEELMYVPYLDYPQMGFNQEPGVASQKMAEWKKKTDKQIRHIFEQMEKEHYQRQQKLSNRPSSLPISTRSQPNQRNFIQDVINRRKNEKMDQHQRQE